jgi:hypothetical protein
LRETKDSSQQFPVCPPAQGHRENVSQHWYEGWMERGVAADYRTKYDVGAGLALAASYLIPRIDRGDLRLDLAFSSFKISPTAATTGMAPWR